MKSKIQKIQILKKGILIILMLAILMPTIAYAYTVNDVLLLQDSTALEKLMYGEIGSIVKKIEKHFKSNTTLYITTENQLRALAAYVDNGNSCYGKRVELLNDITVNTDIDWEPIGNLMSQFSGTFDGNGFSIKNLTYKCRNMYQTSTNYTSGYSEIGFFGVVSDRGIVTNLNIIDSNITTDGTKTTYTNVGNIVGENYGTILNCYANNRPAGTGPNQDIYDTVGLIVGLNKGIVKYSNIGIFTNITNNGYTIIGTNNAIIDLPKEVEGSYELIEGDFEKLEPNILCVARNKLTSEIIYSELSSLSKDIELSTGATVNVKVDAYKNGSLIQDFSKMNILKKGDTLILKFTIDKYLFTGLEEDNKIKLEGMANTEEKKSEFPLVTMGEIVLEPVSATRSTVKDENLGIDKPQTVLEYSYEVTEDKKEESDDEDLVIDFQKNMNDANLYVRHSIDSEDFHTRDLINATVDYSGLNLYLNATIPSLDVKVYAEEASESNRYPEGKEIIIELTSTEKIKDTIAPEINISFSQSGLGKYNYQSDKKIGNAVHVDALLDEKGKTKWIYSYIIQPGDEGDLNIEYLSGSLEDLAGNKNSDITTAEIKNESTIYADTTAPRVEIIPGVQKSATNKDKIIYEFKWNEEISEFNEDDITVINGTKGILIRPGDINEDGEITESDYDLLFEHIKPAPEQDEETEDKEEEKTEEDTEIPEEDEEEPVEYNVMYDVNADGKLNDADIELIEEYLKSNAKLTNKYAKMKITTNVEPGNIIDLKVIVEQDACQDLVGHSNVRTENTVRIDKKAPILNSIEAYADLEDLNISEKAYYTIGDEIKIVATFDESIVVSEDFPTFKLQFSESGDAKGQLEAQIEGNKLVYTYTIADGDYGTLSISGFSGKVLDVAGNETRVTKRVLEGDTILADTIAPKLKEIKVVSHEEGVYRQGNTITFEAIYDEEVYILKEVDVVEKTDEEDNNEENKEDEEEKVVKEEIVLEEVNSSNAPILRIKFNEGVEREAIFKEYGKKEDGSTDKRKLIYTYVISPETTITEEVENENGEKEKIEKIVPGDNGELSIISLENRTEEEEHKKYIVYKDYEVCDIAVNVANNGIDEKNTGIIADTQRPEIKNIYATVEDKIISNCGNYYKAGNEVTITIEFYEKVKALEEILPNIQIGFSEIAGEEPTTYFDYSYEVDEADQPNESEGTDKVEEPEDKTVLNNKIIYKYTIKDGDNGYIWVKVPEGKFEDIAGNTNIDEEEGFLASEAIFADTKAPYLAVNSNGNAELKVEYIEESEGQVTGIRVEALFNEAIYSMSNDTIVELKEMPTLGIFVNGKLEKINNEPSVEDIESSVEQTRLTYIVDITDINNPLTITASLIDGTVYDRAGNKWTLKLSGDISSPIFKDVKVLNPTGYYKDGDKIQILARFEEETTLTASLPTLKIRLGDKEISLNGWYDSEDPENRENIKVARYEYEIVNENGELNIISLTGTVSDGVRTSEEISKIFIDINEDEKNDVNTKEEELINNVEYPYTNNESANVIADTTKPFVVSVIGKVDGKEVARCEKEDGKETVLEVGRINSNQIKYLVTFSEPISELDASKIIITNGIIGEDDVKVIEGTNNREYEITVQTTLEGVQSLIFAEGAVKDRVGYPNLSERFNMVTTDFTKPIVRFISEYNGGVYVLPTNIGKVELRPNIQINEDISSVEYKWNNGEYQKIENYSSSSDIVIPAKAFSEVDSNELFVKVIDLAGNVTETSKTYDILDSGIEIEFNDEYTNDDLTVTVQFGDGLTDNRKVTFKSEETDQIVEINASGTDEEGNTQYIIPTNGTIYVEATDRIGNKVFTEEKIENIDKEAPVVTIGIKEANLVIGTEKDKATINPKVETTDNIGVITNQYLFLQENINLEELDNEKRKSLINKLINSTELYMKLVDSTKGKTPYYLYMYVVDEAGNEVLEKAGPYHVYDTNERKIIVEKENQTNNLVNTIGNNITGNNIVVPEIETEEKIVPPEIEVKGKLIDFKQEGKVVNITYNNFGENEENLNIIREAKITLTEATDGYIDPENNYVEVYKPTTIIVEGKDACGNKVIVTEEITREEIEGPQIEVVGNPENWTNQDVKLEVYSNNKLSVLTVNGRNILSTDENLVSNITIVENGDYKFIATDIYGNTSEKVIKVTKIDKTKPIISKVESSNKTITITATDVVNEIEGSGITEYAITDTTETPIKWSKSNEIKVTHDGTWYAWVMDKVGNITRSEELVIVDTTAPTITFNYALLTVEPGIPIETNITTDEHAIISYSWDNQNWEGSQELLTTVKVAKKYEATGKYTLYAKAVDKLGNESKSQIEFNVTRPEEVLDPQIVFEDLTTVQIDGIRYVKVSKNMELMDITNKMNKKALCGLTPEYTKLTEEDRIRTGSEIMLNGDTKYIVVVNGDVNGDGEIDFVKDIIRANNYRLGIIKLTIPQILAADIDNNGKIEFVKDLILINNYRLGLIKSL